MKMKRSEFLATSFGILVAVLIPGVKTAKPNIIQGFHAQGKLFENITATLEDCSFADCSFVNCHFTWSKVPSYVVNSRFWNDDAGPVVILFPESQGTCANNFFHRDSSVAFEYVLIHQAAA